MSKIGLHYLGRGADQFLIDAGMRVGKWVMSPPPANLPAGFVSVWRWVENPDSINGPMQRNESPEAAADAWVVKQSPHFEDVPKSTWVEGPNENDCENAKQAEWLCKFELYRMWLMEKLGRRCCIFNFGTGRPSLPVHDAGGTEIWTALLPALRYAKANGHLMGMHAYHDSIDEWNMLRYRRVYNWLPADARPKLFIGEWGREPAWRSANGCSDAAYLDLMRRYDAEVMKDDYVVGFAVFTCGTNNSPAWAPFDVAGQPVLNQLAAYFKTNPTEPNTGGGAGEPIPPPDEEPQMSDNLLKNGSFEGGTYTRPDNRSSLFPEGWNVWWADRNTPLLNADAPKGQGKQDQVWDAPEILPRTAAFVRDIPIKDGEAMLKGFKGKAPTWFQLNQVVELEAGRYRLGMWVFPDQVTAYTPQGKVYQKEGNSPDWYLASEVRIGILAQLPDFTDARSVKIGVWNWMETTFELDQQSLATVIVECRGRWGFDNNGWWLDGVTLERIGDAPTPEPDNCDALRAELATTQAELILNKAKLDKIREILNQ